MPLSISFAFKLSFTDSVVFKRGETELKLGQVARQGDRLVEELLQENRRLIQASEKAKRAARRRKVKLPELEEVQQAAEGTRAVVEDLEKSNEELQELVNEQPPIQPIIK